MKRIYSYGKQTIESDDIDSVVRVLNSEWLTQGPAVQIFESNFTDKFNAKYVSAVANGTAGLHLIGLALGWGVNDIILTTPITFLASANCIVYSGAKPDFVDIDPGSYTLNIKKLEHKVIEYEKKNKSIKAVIAVDYAGHPCDWENLKKLAIKYNFQLVNDNCHAVGAEINGDIGYACDFADAVNMSFHPVKHITTGEGGAVLTNNHAIDEKVKNLRTHGITKEAKKLTRNDGPWYYEMQSLGYNYRITDFQCALGASQLKKIDKFIKKRNEIALFYDQQFLNDTRFTVPSVKKSAKHAYHLYPLQIKFDKLKISKNEFFMKMLKINIRLQVHYIPIHMQPYYKEQYGFKEGDFPISESFYRNEVSIPMYPSLESADLQYIAEKIKESAI